MTFFRGPIREAGSKTNSSKAHESSTAKPRTQAGQTVPQLQSNPGNQATLRLMRAESEAASRRQLQGLIHADSSGQAIQPKLTINSPGDAYEREADRVAAQVVQMPDAKGGTHRKSGPGLNLTNNRPGLQRKCSCGGTCDRCKNGGDLKKFDPEQLESGRGDSSTAIESTAIVQKTISSPGQPLDHTSRAFMEPRFGHHFGDVRVHTDADAAKSTREVGARAYTVGNHIAFAPSEFVPHSAGGRLLLSHELTHVVQQSRSNHIAGAKNPGRAVLMRDSRTEKGPEQLLPLTAMSTADAQATLAWHSSMGDDSMLAMSVFTETLRMPFTLENSRMRLQRLIAACSLVDSSGAAAILSALTKPSTPQQAYLRDRFQMLDRRFRIALTDILHKRADVKPVQAPTNFSDDHWSELRDGTFVFAPGAGMTLKQVAHYCTRNPEAPEELSELNQLSADEQIPSGQAVRVPVYFIEWDSRAYAAMSPTLKHKIADAQRLLGTKRDLDRFAKVKPGIGVGLVPVTGIIAEVLSRPLVGFVRFMECLIRTIHGKDVVAWKNRLGVKFYAAMATAFGPGVLVGAGKEIGSIVKQLASIIANPEQILDDIGNVLKLLFSPHAGEFGCAFGQDMGEKTNKDLADLATMGDFEFAYELGKIAGPMLLNTLIAVLLPELLGLLEETVIGKRLLQFLRGIRKELKFLDKWRRDEKAIAAAQKDVRRMAGMEKQTAEAMHFIESHPPVSVKGSAGHRVAELAEGHGEHHTLEEISTATGVHCVFKSEPIPVPCPESWRADAVNDFKLKNKVEVTQGPRPEVTDAEKMHVPQETAPPGFQEDAGHAESKAGKGAGLDPGEAHHIASIVNKKYTGRNRKIFQKAGMDLNEEENLIRNFMEHSRSRGWYKLKNPEYAMVGGEKKLVGGTYQYVMRGHHEDYHKWVTSILEANITSDLSQGEAGRRLEIVLDRLSEVIQAHPDVLQYGPMIFENAPGALSPLKFDWK